MGKVDYLMLSQQYANFLVAVGGVSITALTLVLSLSGKSKAKMGLAEGTARAFLVAALSVATVCCFIGAQMMAETAASISFLREHPPAPPCDDLLLHLGQRLFLLASTNIFIAAVLVLFALMLLPTVSGEKQAANLSVISFSVFALIVLGAIYWMIRASRYRMPAPGGRTIIASASALSVLWGVILSLFITARFIIVRTKIKMPSIASRLLPKKLLNYVRRLVYDQKLRNKYLLTGTFMPMLFFTVFSLLMFAKTFGEGEKSRDRDIFFFTFAVTFSYISLIMASIKIMWNNREEARARLKMRVPVEPLVPPGEPLIPSDASITRIP